MKNIVLSEDQEVCYQKILQIWENNNFVICTAVMGSGKTYLFTKAFLDSGVKNLLVICPFSVENVWYKIGQLLEFEIKIISYETLSSTKYNQPKHPYLSRIDTDETVEFKITKDFKNLVKEGCYLFIDEFHRIKNKNTRYYAVKSLIDYINLKNNSSKIALLSGTPYDYKENVVNTLQILGIINNDNLIKYDKADNRVNFLGLNDLIEYCKNISLEKTLQILSENPPTRKNSEDISYLLYVNILQNELIATMPSPYIEVKIKCYNGYFNMTSDGTTKLTKAINQLNSITRKNTENLESNAITTALRNIQNSKTEIFVRLASSILEQNDTNKVCLFFDFDEPIITCFNELSKYNPVMITGKSSKDDRNFNLDSFQENSSITRLLIFNTSVGAEGINLHDTDGNYKRYAFACPSYYILRLHQMTRRFYRIGTKSEPEICFVYGKCGNIETSLINSLAKKTFVMKDTLTQQVNEGILFPGEYQQYTEDSNNVLILNSVDPPKDEPTIKKKSKTKIQTVVNYLPNLQNSIFTFD